MPIHLLFDLIAYNVGTLLMLKLFRAKREIIADEDLRYFYYTAVVIGVFLGAFILGSLNTYYSIEGRSTIGKSILGAIVGGIIAVEIFKKFTNIRGSTGAYFVPSLVVGIAIGRIGCYLSGLEDYTYGIETSSILGVDFGDGVLRHPVQLYESLVMGLFFIYVVWLYYHERDYFERTIFYQFVLLYSTQRFLWEFLKPYKVVLWGLNIFQLFSLALVVYAIYYIRKSRI